MMDVFVIYEKNTILAVCDSLHVAKHWCSKTWKGADVADIKAGLWVCFAGKSAKRHCTIEQIGVSGMEIIY